jgi:hypothetical protein
MERPWSGVERSPGLVRSQQPGARPHSRWVRSSAGSASGLGRRGTGRWPAPGRCREFLNPGQYQEFLSPGQYQKLPNPSQHQKFLNPGRCREFLNPGQYQENLGQYQESLSPCRYWEVRRWPEETCAPRAAAA